MLELFRAHKARPATCYSKPMIRQMLGSEDRSVGHNARPAAERRCPPTHRLL